MTPERVPPWRERPVEFGPEGRLSGIVTMPPGLELPWTTPALVIMNAGVIHRVGPNRLSVRIARAVAELGMPALRFDLSGLGDSLPRKDARPLTESVALDIRAALDFLASAYGAQRFVTFGLCSGGREAFRAAYRDERVVGAAMIDPYGYRTRRFWTHHYGSRFLRLRSWAAALTGRNQYLADIKRRLSQAPPPQPIDMDICGLPEWPSTAQLTEAVGATLDRTTQLLFVYTGGMPDYYNYRQQLRDMMPQQFGRDGFDYAYIPDSDHTFSSEDHRRLLLRRLQGWLIDTGIVRRNQRARVPSPRVERVREHGTPVER
jgi:pimeloyl-ACP methyl ester carboxylesterase